MARRTKEEALETRENLLNAALDLFCEKGFSQTRLSDVPARIGMTRGALYWHFKDKNDLLVGLFEKIRNREEELVRAEVPDLETLEDLKDHFAAHARVLQSDDMCRKFVFFITQQMEWSMETREVIHKEVSFLRNRPFAEVAETLERAEANGQLQPGTDVSHVADILISLWMGLVMNHMRGFIHSDLEEAVRTGFTVILDSIAVPQQVAV